MRRFGIGKLIQEAEVGGELYVIARSGNSVVKVEAINQAKVPPPRFYGWKRTGAK